LRQQFVIIDVWGSPQLLTNVVTDVCRLPCIAFKLLRRIELLELPLLQFWCCRLSACVPTAVPSYADLPNPVRAILAKLGATGKAALETWRDEAGTSRLTKNEIGRMAAGPLECSRVLRRTRVTSHEISKIIDLSNHNSVPADDVREGLGINEMPGAFL